MPAGFQSFNDAGTYQINDANPNYVFHSAVTVTPGEQVFGNVYSTTIEVPANCIVAFQSAVALTPLRATGTKVQLLQARLSGAAAPVTAYIFQPQPNAPRGNAGLQVWDGAGVLKFDSAYGPLKVVDVIDGEGSFTLPSTSCAVVPVYQVKITTDTLAGLFPSVFRLIAFTYGYIAINGNQLTIGRADLWSWLRSFNQNSGLDFPNLGMQYVQSRYLVVDVSGIHP
ncbi:hypothetical protein DJFAAGMI_01261 [Comamonas sp. PE63]|uniref:Uncharacterized protein n=1 Tax=Comamonas brasiliensis TaxID=1812482 RepID=A0ABS5LPV2_9BURK|nr:hypothetical protein [Comamonas sp. PE63]MBS3018529.1 hypothetical protein [Comamonas sp. PE63]